MVYFKILRSICAISTALNARASAGLPSAAWDTADRFPVDARDTAPCRACANAGSRSSARATAGFRSITAAASASIDPASIGSMSITAASIACASTGSPCSALATTSFSALASAGSRSDARAICSSRATKSPRLWSSSARSASSLPNVLARALARVVARSSISDVVNLFGRPRPVPVLSCIEGAEPRAEVSIRRDEGSGLETDGSLSIGECEGNSSLATSAISRNSSSPPLALMQPKSKRAALEERML